MVVHVVLKLLKGYRNDDEDGNELLQERIFRKGCSIKGEIDSVGGQETDIGVFEMIMGMSHVHKSAISAVTSRYWPCQAGRGRHLYSGG